MLDPGMTLSSFRGSTKKAAIWLAGMGVLLLVAYAETIRGFVAAWSGRDDYSHGFLVPFISGYFVWLKRERLCTIKPRPDVLWGTALLSIGCALLFTGTMGSAFMAQQISVLVVIPGLVLLLFGRAVFREVLLPLGYLVFMVPAVIDPLLGRLHWPLQLIGAAGAAMILEIVGVPVIRHQQFLELPNITLEVANQCSGLRYLISIIALSVPLAYISVKSHSKRVALILAGIIIGIVANPVRIALIGVWVYRRGSAMIHGPSHLFQGFFVSMVGMGFLFLVAWGFALFERGRPEEKRVFKPGTSCGQWALVENRVRTPWTIAAAVLVVLACAILFYRPVKVPLANRSLILPGAIGAWRGRSAPRLDSPLRLEKASAESEMAYQSPSGSEVQLYIGYLEAQTQGIELIYYTHKAVYAAGVEVQQEGPGGRRATMNQAVLARRGSKLLVLYYYDIGGRRFANEVEAKVFSGIRGVLSRRTNGAVVAMTRLLQDGEQVETAFGEMLDFAREASPTLSALLAVDGGVGVAGAPAP